MNLDIQIENVIKDTTSCNFCHRGQLKESHPAFIYPYENVVTFSRLNASGIKVSICADCLKELCEMGLPMLNKEQEVQGSDTTMLNQGTDLCNQKNTPIEKLQGTIDWEGLEKEAKKHFPDLAKKYANRVDRGQSNRHLIEWDFVSGVDESIEWLKTNINNYIKNDLGTGNSE